MHNHLIAVACLSLLLSSSAAHSRGFIILGQGNVSCGKWTDGRRTNGASALGYSSWVLGYLSAYNSYALKHSSDITQGTDNSGVLAWIDNYCRDNPLENIRSATDALIIELQKRSGAY
jgi:hypothetical protein